MIKGLYVITDSDRDGNLAARVEAALQGGARVIQYRDKELPAERRIEAARQLAGLCRKVGATFIVNDDANLAAACEADGVHLGQGDGTVAEARKILGHQRIIGVSTRTVEQALKAETQGADYIGVGSIYPTGTKQDTELVGIDTLKKVRRAVKIPIVAIGGIDRERADEAITAGADAVAVISAVMADPFPSLAAREIALQFNRHLPYPRGRVLSVAGSDSGGGAGIQADLKTITLLGAFGSSALTALTAQNTRGVRGIHPCPEDFVADQIEAVLSDLGADTVKTGMLYSAEIIGVVARALKRRNLLTVVDPVMIAKGGAPLLQQQAVDTLLARLLPLTYLITPNIPEAEAIAGLKVKTEADMEVAARALQKLGARNVLIKGGHLPGPAVDLLLAGDSVHRFGAERLETPNTHGTGCTYSAAIATFIAQGMPLVKAVEKAKAFITEAIRSAVPLGSGHGPVNHWQAAKAVISDE
ncbi:thiamine biosynthesis bifunctional protein ThiED [Desulfuromonas versatilis]|uniref:Thiamine-phosphate synthase n=1 Tax=Desulfuromonas versatilis TaxID=2802975 RepID=A0ABN6DVA4_9BACT|nr:bifunctional hydroxymethylpyrimidine kinase/phosphomethylpyrimidine kinase [Desulfuromonas versatilis]BCR03921.1 thiamine biosynthesis bifunctional protein ThiED [Desulfuromonas versatilis]